MLFIVYNISDTICLGNQSTSRGEGKGEREGQGQIWGINLFASGHRYIVVEHPSSKTMILHNGNKKLFSAMLSMIITFLPHELPEYSSMQTVEQLLNMED